MNRQFRILVCHFFLRFFAVDSVAFDDGPYIRILQLLAILAIPGLLISFFLIPDHPPGSLIMAAAQTEAERLWLRVGDRYVFVAYAMTAMGLLMAFKWDSLFPDRQDYLILTALPIGARKWFAAKTAALSLFLSMFVVAINLFSLLIIPAIVAGRIGSGWDVFAQAFGAHAAATIGGSIFAAVFFVGLQGVLINILPAGTFRRLSPLVQAISIFALATLLLITPLVKESIPPLSKSNSRLLDHLPTMWFLGIYESLLPGGTLIPQSIQWAHTAINALGTILVLLIVSYWLGYHRYSRKILETPESPLFVPRIPHMMAGNFIDRIFLQNGTQRGTFHFVKQVSGRSSKHRILMALYTAIGTALALSSLFVIDTNSSATYPLKLSSTGSLQASLILTFVMIAGLRATFNVSSDINANWIFRTAGSARPESYRAATQKWVFLYRIMPLFVVLAAFEVCVFPPSTAFCHLMFDLSSAALLFEAFFLSFNKIPFTCAYGPKKLQLVVVAAAYLYGFTIYVQIAGGLKAFVAATPALDLARSGRMAVFLSAATILFIVLRRYQSKAPITFGDSGSPLLDISSDAAYWSPPHGVHGTTAAPSRCIKMKLVRFLALVSAAALVGVGFEQAGRYLDRRAYPQVGQSFAVGGRSLNISCLGTGKPTVLLESDVAVAGYSWLTTQREIGRFAHVCWYDRAGYGWSDPGPFPNHSDSVARDLHNLLAAAHISPPYVLVGHGMGAFHVRVYNGLYPDDTRGMVLVDPMNEDTTIQVHNHNEALRPAMIEFAETLGFLGLLRLIAPGPGVAPNHGWTQAEWNTAIAMAWQPRSAVAHIHEPPLWISGELARRAGDLRDFPVIVLSGEKHAPLFRGQNVQLELDRHEALSRRSMRGRHTIVANSGYWNPYTQPEAVVDAVRDVVLELRSYSQP